MSPITPGRSRFSQPLLGDLSFSVAFSDYSFFLFVCFGGGSSGGFSLPFCRIWIGFLFTGRNFISFQKSRFINVPHMHDLLEKTIYTFAPFSYVNRLPNNRHNPWACLWGLLLLVLVMLAFIRYQLHRPKMRRMGFDTTGH